MDGGQDCGMDGMWFHFWSGVNPSSGGPSWKIDAMALASPAVRTGIVRRIAEGARGQADVRAAFDEVRDGSVHGPSRGAILAVDSDLEAGLEAFVAGVLERLGEREAA